MASSKLMSSRNSDLISRNSSTSTTRNNNTISRIFQMTLPPTNNQQITLLDAAADSRQQTVATSSSSKNVDDVWKAAAGRSCKQEAPDEMMTLEDFLAKAVEEEEEDVKVPPPPLPSFNYPPNVNVDGFGIRPEEIIEGGRGKRRAILETLDKAAQQRQRRMIKNRESAARSRERKQAYQAELESLAVKLEEENEKLLKVKMEQTRKRYKQLMDNIIPVTEKQRPRRYVLRKVRSMEW